MNYRDTVVKFFVKTAATEVTVKLVIREKKSVNGKWPTSSGRTHCHCTYGNKKNIVVAETRRVQASVAGNRRLMDLHLGMAG